jgi:hypothetical protein
VAYERGFFEALLAAHGLAVERFVAGFHPGGERPPRGQDALLLAPAGDAPG